MAGGFQISASEACIPFQDIRRALSYSPKQRPDDRLQHVVAHRRSQLQAPWQLARPAESSADAAARALAAASVTDVGGSSIPVKASRKDLATRLAATAGISPVDAYVVVDGFMQRQAQKGGDEQTGEEQWYSLLDWYEEECLALPAVSTELLDLAATTDDEAPEWIHIGVTEVGGWPEADEHIKQLFIGWRNLAQRAITEEQRRDNHGLYWARLQLEIQVQTLNILFLRLYRANDRTAATAEALLRAAVLSGFGTEQANRDVWEGDRACGVLADRIRDMLTLIALDAMCLGLALEADLDASLLGDGDVISRVQMFLANQTQFLHGEEANAAETPVALLLVAWAFILQHLPEDRQPPTSGYDQPIHQVMLNRAFRAEAGLIPFMEQLVAGPILTDPTDSTLAVFTRKAFKDLLIAYGHVVPEHRTQGPDAIAINMMWSNLYASGGPKTALTLASDFWVTYAHDAERVNVLETDFPLDPVSLPRLLAACSGITSPNATASELASDEVSSIRQTYDQFAELWGMTVPTPDHFYRSRGTTAEGDELVVAAIDIVLPGEVKLLRGLQGQIVRVEGDSKVVKWHVQYSGWRVLLEVLKVAVGMRELGEVINTDRTEYAVENLGITRPTPAVLASGLALFSVVLKPISGLAEWLLQDLNGRNGNGMALEILLAIAISVLTQHAGSSDGATDDDVAAVLSSIDILTSLVHISPEVAFNTFRRTQFFALPSKRSSPACSLIQKDGRGTTHAITLASLRLVRKMCEVSVQYPAQVDETVLRSALHHVNVDIWQEMAGWQYETDAMRQDLAVAVCGTFEAAIIHPFGSDGKTLGAAAKSTVELFIHTATGSTYKPLAELLTSHAAGSTRRTRKKKNSKDDETRRAATSMLSALLRIAIQLGTPATVLPASLLTSAGVYRNERLPIIDILLSSAIAPSADSETSTALLRCISTYLDTTALMPSKISLASQLTDVQKTCSDIANLAASAPTSEQRIAGWKLLSSIMLSQPGAHIFCIGSAGQIAQPLEIALNELEQGEEMLDESADILAALLVFLLAVIGSPALFSVSDAIHQRDKLWKAVFAIAIRNIPTPPTFTLSRHADDFATDITAYAYMTQARATAVAVLAVEVDLLAELEGEMETTGHGTEETVIKQLLISEYRSAAKLGALAHAAVRNGCEPEEHVAEEAKLQERGVAINAYRTMQSPAERSYGTRYFYDSLPCLLDTKHQKAVNTSFELLNLNWSILDADNAFTRAFHRLTESMATWLQDDGLAAKAALQATGSVTHTIAAEERPGEIMAAVQVERLWILATLLETAFDAAAAPDDAAVGELAIEMRKIIDSPILAAVDAARDPLLPPIHRPLLRISRLLLKQVAMMPRRSNQVHAFIEMAGEFILDASCAAFDAMSRDAHLESDLVLAVEPLIELINTGTSTWLDQFAESGLILRSLILIKRIPKGTHVPTYIPSILLFHLALANHPQAAEKLAVSGIIPAYSDNAVTIAAEEGDIKPDSDVLSVHSAWCGMLLVVQSLLTTLPEPANFARDQVASFVRLANQQIHAAFERFEQDEKNGSAQSTALFRASLDELRLTVEVLFGMARAAPGNVRVFADYQTALVHLLTNVTRALNHPRRFADSIVPTSVEEHGQLAKELEILDKQPEGATVLVKMAETPFLGSQVMVVLQIAQMALRALIGMTNTWAVLRGQREPKAELVLEADDVIVSASMDPISKINDLQSAVTSLAPRITSTGTDTASALMLQTCHHIAEAATVLAASQILVRRTMLLRRTGSAFKNGSSNAGDDDRKDDDGGMMIDSKPSSSSETSPQKGKGKEAGLDEATLLDDLEQDWRTMINGANTIGDGKLGRWLEECLEKTFMGDE